MKQTTARFIFVKMKESEQEDVYTFVGANTLPDRVPNQSKSGDPVKGEILSKTVLDKLAVLINDETKSGDNTPLGSFRTVSLFHDRVHSGDYGLEEAGFVIPGTAFVQEMTKSPGNHELLVDVKVNKHYVPKSHPDYTPEKIKYKIDNGVMGISLEYNNRSNQERTVSVNGDKYNYVTDFNSFTGFGFARANLIGNPGAVRVKEILIAEELKIKTKEGDTKMSEEETKIKEKLEAELVEKTAKIKELEEEKKVAEEAKDDKKVEELEKKAVETEEKVKELKLQINTDAQKMKETLELAFSSLNFESPAKVKEADAKKDSNAKVKEIYQAVEDKDFVKFKEITAQHLVKNETKIKELMEGNGFKFEKWQTVEVKCKGNGSGQMVIMSTQKTKDVLDGNDMAEGTYNQTNAMFADRYVAGITETFLMEDSLLTAVSKEQHLGGNDKAQYRLWVDYTTVSGDNTSAVDPNNTSVQRTVRKFEKMESPIREYREGVEVTDFTQHHSMSAIGDLLGIEITRAAEVVTESLNADLFKGKVEATSGWLGVNGLIGYADSSTHGVLYGKTRTAANRLLDATLTNTYDSSSESISASLLRKGYNKVLAHGSKLASLSIVIHPTQYQRFLDTEDSSIRHPIVTMMSARPSFGFDVSLMPFFDGVIPMIRDYRCESSANAADMFCVVDMSPNKGFNLVVSKELGARGLAKIGTSESAYVSFWGCTLYKSPRNVFVHDSLTTA